MKQHKNELNILSNLKCQNYFWNLNKKTWDFARISEYFLYFFKYVTYNKEQ